MESFLSSLFYFIILISILVVIHEFGHFISARLTGMRVDIFSVGMGFRVLGWSKKDGFKFGKLPKDWDSEGSTDYRLSLFPVGGYVKIAGMIDESFDTNFINKEPQPYEFRSKKTWQKAITISAGVILNAALAVAIFGGLKFFNGESLRGTTTIGYVDSASVAANAGLMAGDKVLEVDGKKVDTFEDLLEALAINKLGSNKTVIVERNGEKINLAFDGSKTLDALSKETGLGIYSDNMKIFIRDVVAGAPAEAAGILANDTVLAANGIPLLSHMQFRNIIKTNAGIPITVLLKRGADTMSLQVTPSAEGLIGIEQVESYVGQIQTRNFGLFASIGAGFADTWRALELSYLSIKHVVAGNIPVKQAIGGPIMIAKKASQSAEMGISSFLSFVGLISITLAIINILPFPALDGGHLIFIIIEGIIRREVPVKIKLAIQNVGFFILLALMGLVIVYDIIR